MVNRVTGIKVTSSRLAMTVWLTAGLCFPAKPIHHFLVWDWKTGVKYVVSSTEIC